MKIRSDTNASTPARDSAVERETILLVDDNESVRKALSALLGLRNYSVLEAGSGEEGMEIAARHDDPIHLLITDVMLPQMSGLQFADQFSAQHPDAKILFVSGATEDSVGEENLKPGTAFLQKPVTMKVLVDKIRSLLDAE